MISQPVPIQIPRPARSARTAVRRPRVAEVCRSERKLVTVMFADLKGSTDLARTIELDEWWIVMSDLYDLMCESVHRFGGWVSNFTGDGVKAVFEAPGVPEEHVVCGCEAALWIQAASRERHPELSLRVGINTGEVLTGTIGDRRSRCYTVTGYPVALAKRMETLAQPGRVYLTHYSAALAESRLDLEDLGAFEVKGAGSPVGVYELIGTRW